MKGAKSEAEINSHPPSSSQSSNQQSDRRQTPTYTLKVDEYMDKFFNNLLLAEENETQGCHSTDRRQTSTYLLTFDELIDEFYSNKLLVEVNETQDCHSVTGIVKGAKSEAEINSHLPSHALNELMEEFFHCTLLAEENETQGIPPTPLISSPAPAFPMQEISLPIIQADGIILNDQPSLPRQGYLNIPGPTIKRVPQSYDYMLPPPQQQQQPLGLNQNCVHLNSGPNFPLIHGMAMEENRGGNPQTPPGNGGGYMVSPGWSGGMCNNKVDGRKSNRGRKMVDRRPKIMLTNREREQARTSEFDEEVMFLVGENKRLKQSLAELESEKYCRCSAMRKRRREENANMRTKSQKVYYEKLMMQYYGEVGTRANANMGTKSQKIYEKLKMQYYEEEETRANANMETKSQRVYEKLKMHYCEEEETRAYANMETSPTNSEQKLKAMRRLVSLAETSLIQWRLANFWE